MIERTPWFPCHVKPVRHGLYERNHGGGYTKFSHWNGEFWGGWAKKKTHAYNNRHNPSTFQHLEWRGVLQRRQPDINQKCS